jgi:Zn-dependent protease with chaperone function
MVEKPTTFQGRVSHSDWDDTTAASTLKVLSGVITSEFESGVAELPLEGLQIECGRRKEDWVWFTHPAHPGWTFSTPDKTILAERPFQKNFGARRQIQAINTQVDDWKRLKTTVYFVIGFFVVAILAMNLMGWLLDIVVNRIPIRYEVQIGDEVSKKIEEDLMLVSAPGTTNAIKAHLSQLLGQKAAAKYDSKVAIYSSLSPNAFVIPGGYFYVSSALLSFAETPEELAGVLAHEAAHLKRHHGMRKLIADQGHGFLFKWIVGNQRNLLTALSAGADLLVNQTYSRELEFEADDQGWDMLLAANIDPRGTISIFKKLDALDAASGKASSSARLLRSHPLTQERIDRLNKKWERCPKKSGFIKLERIAWSETNAPSLDPLLRLLK